MSDTVPHFLLLEPYYGGSHRSFLNGLRQHLPYRFTLISLPARKWKMRMQLAAPWMADKVIRLVRSGSCFDGILCSTFLDVAMLRTILYNNGIVIPLAVYFHENQFAYPNQINDPGRYQFSALNYTSAVAADRVVFNSKYNLETFFSGVQDFTSKATDMQVNHVNEGLRKKASVLHPGIDFSTIDSIDTAKVNDIPVIVWNHRWEHDKDPDTFFHVLQELSNEAVDFRLIVLGQSFARKPEVFNSVRDRFAQHIEHIGYVEERKDYLHLLHQGDIAVSTAKHEFFGMSMLEAVRSGCRPLVPERLAYLELFDQKHRYGVGELKAALRTHLEHFTPLSQKDAIDLTERFSWPIIAGKYRDLFESLIREHDFFSLV